MFCFRSLLSCTVLYYPGRGISQAYSLRPRDAHQKYTRGLIVHRAPKIHTDIFAHLFPKFYRGSKSAKFGLYFRHQSHLPSSDFEMGQDVGNLKHICSWSADDKLRFNLDNSSTSPQFYKGGGSNSATFSLILDFKALQFQNEAMYLTPNTNEGVPTMGVCKSPKNLAHAVRFPISEKLG